MVAAVPSQTPLQLIFVPAKLACIASGSIKLSIAIPIQPAVSVTFNTYCPAHNAVMSCVISPLGFHK